MTKRRATLAIVMGVVIWGLLWNLGTRVAQATFPDLLGSGQPITHTGILFGYIAYGGLLSVMAGYIVGRASGGRTMTVVWVFAVVQLSIGVVAEASYWGLMPAWYHLIFLALVVPATVAGGMSTRSVATRPATA